MDVMVRLGEVGREEEKGISSVGTGPSSLGERKKEGN